MKSLVESLKSINEDLEYYTNTDYDSLKAFARKFTNGVVIKDNDGQEYITFRDAELKVIKNENKDVFIDAYTPSLCIENATKIGFRLFEGDAFDIISSEGVCIGKDFDLSKYNLDTITLNTQNGTEVFYAYTNNNAKIISKIIKSL